MVNAAPALANGVPNVPELVIFEVGAENATGRMEKLSVEQLVTVGETTVGYRTRTRTSRYALATLKAPVVPRPLVRLTAWGPAIVTGAPGQPEPPVDPVTRSTCAVLVSKALKLPGVPSAGGGLNAICIVSDVPAVTLNVNVEATAPAVA